MEHRGRRLPIGAELRPEGVHFRVWAPRRQRVEVVLEAGAGAAREEVFALEGEPGGYFSGLMRAARSGRRYRFRLDGGDRFPDPASRCQPEGPHGPSEVVDPDAFRWTDQDWPGVSLPGQVIYEMHVGTFTPAGTFDAAARELPGLRELGVTVLEVMPVAEFPGRFGWGYDGVDLFAPTRLYGGPEAFRRFVDRAHQLGLAVILDVVYNHLGPDGNYLSQYSESYFSKVKTEWGQAINFDQEGSGPVREFFLANAAYWMAEFHLDGLRLDATQNMYDRSEEHVLAAIARAARQAAGARRVVIVAENESQEAKLVRPPGEGGYGLDAVWNDDFHHAAMVALLGHREAYHYDYLGTPQELVSATKYGYLYQGQRYEWQEKRRGTSALGLPPRAFVTFLENHDQVANWDGGRRLYAQGSPARYRALLALTLLGPGTPMLFQGQEFFSSRRFVYFADHQGELARAVAAGRHEFLSQWKSFAATHRPASVDPADPAAFAACKLDPAERERNVAAWRLHRDLLRLRREDPVLAAQGAGGLDGAVLTSSAFVLRFFAPEGGDRLLLVNLGRDVDLRPAPEPLLAPPSGRRWARLWSSQDPAYGGTGIPAIETEETGWWLPADTTVLMAAERGPEA